MENRKGNCAIVPVFWNGFRIPEFRPEECRKNGPLLIDQLSPLLRGAELIQLATAYWRHQGVIMASFFLFFFFFFFFFNFSTLSTEKQKTIEGQVRNHAGKLNPARPTSPVISRSELIYHLIERFNWWQKFLCRVAVAGGDPHFLEHRSETASGNGPPELELRGVATD